MTYKYPYLNAEMPTVAETLAKTPNDASRSLFARLERAGVETFLDRFAAQQPQCRFGLTGVCCRRCLWGPCRISEKTPRGICGADQNLIVAGNLLRGLAAGCSAHGSHALHVLENLIAAAGGEGPFIPAGEERIKELACRFAPDVTDPSLWAQNAAEMLLDCVTGRQGRIIQLMEAYAPPEQLEKWRQLEILPRSAMEEVFQALQITTLGSCSDWKNILKQELRTALAYCYGALAPACLGQEMLFGVPQPTQRPVEVNYGVLRENAVNLVIHGHSPVLAESLVKVVSSPAIKAATVEAGAEKVVLVGACCTGSSLLSRHGIPAAANILAMELIMATGAVDALVLDMQCAIPGIEAVARCFGGEIITTDRGNRFPGDRHIPFTPQNVDEKAREICLAAVENFRRRRGKEIFIPALTTRAVAGWAPDSFFRALGGLSNAVRYLEEGKIKGLVSIGGCNSPKVPYEYNHVTLARELIRHGVLLFTTGCAAYSLLNAGLASPEAAELAAPGLKEICRRHGLPPVLPMGSCTDNFRLLRIYAQTAAAAGIEISRLPVCHSGPAPGSEKNIGQGLSFLLHGVSVHQGFPGGIPVPIPQPAESPQYVDDWQLQPGDVARFFAQEAFELLGARIYVEPYPELAAKTIQMHLHRQRLQLGWPG